MIKSSDIWGSRNYELILLVGVIRECGCPVHWLVHWTVNQYDIDEVAMDPRRGITVLGRQEGGTSGPRSLTRLQAIEHCPAHKKKFVKAIPYSLLTIITNA
jgi:hypothetical protein